MPLVKVKPTSPGRRALVKVVTPELHKRVQRRSPAFDQFFYQAVKDHVLADGRIGREQADWLRQALFAGRKPRDEDRKFLHELKGEAKQMSPAFETLYTEVMKQPHEQHTSGPFALSLQDWAERWRTILAPSTRPT